MHPHRCSHSFSLISPLHKTVRMCVCWKCSLSRLLFFPPLLLLFLCATVEAIISHESLGLCLCIKSKGSHLSRVLVTWGKVCRKSVKAALNPKRSHFTSLQALFHQMRSKFKILRNLALPRKAAYSFWHFLCRSVKIDGSWTEGLEQVTSPTHPLVNAFPV